MSKNVYRTMLGVGAIGCLLAAHSAAVYADRHALETYRALESHTTYDRSGTLVQVAQNARAQTCLFASEYPESLRRLVLQKEDQWFYYHPGMHPLRTAQAALAYLFGTPVGGASTVTQQLAKTLLGTGTERTIHNKLRELMLAFALEYRHSKDGILTMYLNTVPLGGTVAGFPAAARTYFDKPVEALTESETLMLVAALSRPTSARPLTDTNFARAVALAQVLGSMPPTDSPEDTGTPYPARLELADLMRDHPTCTASLDTSLTERLREVLARHLARTDTSNATHGAIAVVAIPSGEMLGLVGSPAPDSTREGMRINMALATRPVGSTVKPFLYLRAFEKGARPYTLVDDREYAFPLEDGAPLYPKNYDGTFHGIVTLEESLANSLNVPAVLVERFIGLPDTYRFLGDTIGFTPAQPWESYAYGIALGGLELDLLTLTHAFTLFGTAGALTPLVVGHDAAGAACTYTPPHSTLSTARKVAPPEHVSLVHAILSDRAAGVEQFGVNGTLELSRSGYGVKTGTSRDYHDSWTVGYTGDYAVGVWIGNAENKPMRGVSGALGAGSVWHDVMELLYTTPYYTGRQVPNDGLVRIEDDRGYAWGLPGDDVEKARGLMLDTTLITHPHNGDTFLYTAGMRIPLTATREARWSVGNTPLSEPVFHPARPGTYILTATANDTTESVTIHVTETADPAF